MIFLKTKPHRNEKIFCIGRNKTGTTSLEATLKEFGFKMGDQREGENLIKYYKNYNWKPIIDFCKTAEAFQDIPFSLPYTWQILHHYFPNSKFILTIRPEEEWYRSLTSFHSKLFSNGIGIPNKDKLLNANYNHKGFMWEANRAEWKTPEYEPYQKELLIENYRAHNTSVLNYFYGSPKFLRLDLSEKESYLRLATFLEKEPTRDCFPHLNKT